MKGWGLAIALSALTACAAPTDDEPSPEATEDALALQSAPLASGDMKRIPQPAGMPKPHEQPDSGGLFDERGKCGPTAVANALMLYWVNVTPRQADHDGAHHWLVGTMGRQIESYLQREHAELGCTLEHPVFGATFLRKQLSTGHPVMLWYNTEGLQSHWVTAVGIRGTGDAESVIVMSWGSYYSIPLKKLVGAWRNVYGIRNPAVVCSEKTTLIAR
jgi:hypothetical protein